MNAPPTGLGASEGLMAGVNIGLNWIQSQPLEQEMHRNTAADSSGPAGGRPSGVVGFVGDPGTLSNDGDQHCRFDSM